MEDRTNRHRVHSREHDFVGTVKVAARKHASEDNVRLTKMMGQSKGPDGLTERLGRCPNLLAERLNL
jgi:hypothetical protein